MCDWHGDLSCKCRICPNGYLGIRYTCTNWWALKAATFIKNNISKVLKYQSTNKPRQLTPFLINRQRSIKLRDVTAYSLEKLRFLLTECKVIKSKGGWMKVTHKHSSQRVKPNQSFSCWRQSKPTAALSAHCVGIQRANIGGLFDNLASTVRWVNAMLSACWS